MRFSSTKLLPTSEWYFNPDDVRQVAADLVAWNMAFGLDTETDGLGFTYFDHKNKLKFSGDGLGAKLEVVCLAFGGRRIAIDCGDAHIGNRAIIIAAIHEVQQWACCYNGIFDYNVIESNIDWEWKFNTMWADGLVLWQQWDEDAEDTYGNRGLKFRATHYLGIPMTDFGDLVLKNGGIRVCLDTPRFAARTRNYCTKDGWAHLGLATLGWGIARKLPWKPRCPHCGHPCFDPDDSKLKWYCVEHDWIDFGTTSVDAAMMTAWDWHREWDVPFLKLLKDAQQRGTPVNKERLESWTQPVEEACERHLQEFQRQTSEALVALGGAPIAINPNSNPQLQKFYFEDFDANGVRVGLGLPMVKRTKSGGKSTDEDTLKALHVLHNPAGIKELLAYKGKNKTLTTFLRGLPGQVWAPTGRLHPRIRPDTATTRISCRSPNLTQLPRDAIIIDLPAQMVAPAESPEELAEMWSISLVDAAAELALPKYSPEFLEVHIRNAIEAPEGWKLVGADYAQLEVRLTAMESGDANLIRVINAGMDMHSYTASRVYQSKVPGLTYEDVYEAKKYKDGNFLPRLQMLGQILTSGEGDALIDRRGKDLSGSQRLEQKRLLAHLLERIRGAVDRDGRIQLLNPKTAEDVAALLELLGDELSQEWFEIVSVGDKLFLKLRQAAKNAIFGIIYGIGPMGLAVQITDATGERTTKEETAPLIDAIKYEAYPGIGRMVERLHNTVGRYGYVRTRMGRYRHPAGIFSRNTGRVARGKRQAGNAPIQGWAANIMELVMITMDRDPVLNHDLEYKLHMQIHDELLGSAPDRFAQEALERKIWHMEHSHRLRTQVELLAEGGVAQCWGDIK
jgi:DNA polymerase I-like protein with 3'-5' exonuclease and polymerase domains